MRELKFRVWDTQNKCYVENKNGGIEWSIWELEHLGEYKDRVIIEQYTGLKDKNGKEVYEGDIVKCGPYCGRPIVFEEGRYWLGEEPDDLFTSSVHWDIEIIGNIHENPELLEEEK